MSGDIDTDEAWPSPGEMEANGVKQSIQLPSALPDAAEIERWAGLDLTPAQASTRFYACADALRAALSASPAGEREPVRAEAIERRTQAQNVESVRWAVAMLLRCARSKMGVEAGEEQAADNAFAVLDHLAARERDTTEAGERWFLRVPADPDSRPMHVIYRHDLRPGEDFEPVGPDLVQVLAAARPAPVTGQGETDGPLRSQAMPRPAGMETWEPFVSFDPASFAAPAAPEPDETKP